MSNRQVLKQIINLAGELKPLDGVNSVLVAARVMLAQEPPQSDRFDGLTNQERMEINKQKRAALEIERQEKQRIKRENQERAAQDHARLRELREA